MKDGPIQYSWLEEDLKSVSVDGPSIASDFARRMRKQQASSTMRMDHNDMLKATTPVAMENVRKEEEKTRETETRARLYQIYPHLFGRGTQENNATGRDSPPPDVILVQDGSFAGSEISSIERTYTNYINQSDFPNKQQDWENRNCHTAIKDQSHVVEEDPPQTSEEARVSLSQKEETESLASEASVKAKHKLKSFRLFPGIVDAMARRKNKIADARDRRRILEEKRAGTSKKRSLLKRHSKTDIDLLSDDQIQVQRRMSLNPSEHEQRLSPTSHEPSRDVEVMGQDCDLESSALDKPDQIPVATGLFTREQVENFLDDKAASLANSELANFEALYHTFLSSLQVGKDEQEQVLTRLPVESDGYAAANPSVGPFDLDEADGVVNLCGINTDEPENVVQVVSAQSGLGQTSEGSFETGPKLACGSSSLEQSLDQSSQVTSQVPDAFEGHLHGDILMVSSSVNQEDDTSEKSIPRASILDKYLASYPTADEKKPVVIGRAIKGRGKERKWFEAVGVKSRAKYLAISLEPSNTGSVDSLEGSGTMLQCVDLKPDESEIYQKPSLDGAPNQVEEEDVPNHERDVQNVDGGTPSENGDATIEKDDMESRKEDALCIARDKDDITQTVSDDERDMKSLRLTADETEQPFLDGNGFKGVSLSIEAVETEDPLDEIRLSISTKKETPNNFGSTTSNVLSLDEHVIDKETGEVGFTVPDPDTLHGREVTESQTIDSKLLLPNKENRKRNIFSGPFPLEEQGAKSQVSGGKSLPSIKNSSVQNKKTLGLSRFRKKVESKGTGKTGPSRAVPLDKVLSTPFPQARVKKITTPLNSSELSDTDKANSLQRSVTCPHGVIAGGDLLRPTVPRKKSRASTGGNEINERTTPQGVAATAEWPEPRQTASGDESTNNRQSLLDTETFDSYQTDRFEDEEEDDDDEDEDSVLLDGDCRSYSNFLDWVGRWILPLGGSKVCVPVDEDKHVSDYAPQLKAVVAAGVEKMNSFGSNVPSPMSYEELGKIEAGICNDVRVLVSGLDLITKLDLKK